MARTPDRRPGEADEEGIVLENRSPGDNPTIAGGIRYVNGAFSFKDSLGLFNPRSQLSAAGYDTEIQYNYLGFLSASSDLKFARDRSALVATNISGSLTRLVDGTSYIIAGGNVSVVTGSNGSITLSTINSGTISNVSSGTGLLGGGSSGSVSLRIDDSIVATISGTTFSGSVKFNSGLSGSLTKLVDGTSYIAAGVGINVSTGSTGRITISLGNTGSLGTYGSATQVPVFSTDAQGRVTNVVQTSIQISESQVTNLSSSLNARALKTTSITAGNGLLGGGNLSQDRTLSVDNSIVATVSGTTFSGAVNFDSGLSGSLTRLTSGDPYIIGGSNVIVTTGSNGTIVIDAVGGTNGGSLVDGFGTANYVSKWQDTNTLTDSIIYDDGTSVGIGTVSGGDKFTVFGNSSFTGSLLPGSDSTYDLGSAGRRWNVFSNDLQAYGTSQFHGNLVPAINSNYDIGTTSSNWRNIFASNISGSLTGSGLSLGSVVFSGPGGLLTGSNSKLFWDNSNSRLGIGTDSPNMPLEVFGTSGSLFSVSDNLSGSLMSICGVSGVPIFEVFSDFKVNLGGGFNSSAMVVTGAIVGIGTSTPSGRLHALGASSGTSPVFIAQAGASSPTAKIIDVRSSAGSTVASIDHLGIFSGSYGSFTANVTAPTVIATLGLSGSLTKLSNGSSYLVAGSNVAITSGSNGSVTISSTGTLTGVTAGQGLAGGGNTGTVSLSIDDSVVATISGSTFTGVTKHTAGISGSLTRLTDGSSYLVAGNNVLIATGSNGSVTISSVTNGASVIAGSNSQLQFNDSGEFGASAGLTYNKTTQSLTGTYVVAATGFSGSLTRLTDGSSYLVAGTGISIATGSNGAITIINDGTVGDITAVNAGLGLLGGGTSGAVTLNVDNSVVATVSGTTFTGATKHAAGLSGSLTNLVDGSSYIRAGGGITVATGSNGSVTISLGAISYATASFTNATTVTVNHDVGISLYDIEVFDTSYSKMLPKSATATTPTQADIEFSIPTSGYIAIGGPVAGGSGAAITSGSTVDLTNLTTNIVTTGQITGSAISLTGGSQELITPTTGSAPYYGSRAWVNFNGTGVVAIRASSNVSSITDVGVGSYRVNFSTPMPDTNYCALGLTQWSGGPYIVAHNSGYLTSSFALITGATAGSGADLSIVNVVVFR